MDACSNRPIATVQIAGSPADNFGVDAPLPVGAVYWFVYLRRRPD